MNISDYWGWAFFGEFGFWFILFPASVIRFYLWFHRGKIAMLKPNGVRIAGFLWLILVLGVFLSSFK